MRSDGSTVAVEDRDGVRWITLRRPPVNALGLAEYAALEAAFGITPAPDGPQVVVLRADGRVFCGGQDVHELAGAADAVARADYLARATRGVAAAARCPVPVVAVADGPAVGAGALLLACTDLVVATGAASVRLPELRVGALMGLSLLRGFLPDPLARHALVTGDPLPAERLHAVGALAEVVRSAELDARATAVVTGLMDLGHAARAYLRAGSDPDGRARAYETEVAAAVAALHRRAT